MKKNRFYFLILRYIILVLVALPNLYLFYSIFTPLTIFPVFYLLNIFFKTSLTDAAITFNGTTIHLVKACIAGSAYYLLLILNLTTPMKIKKRIFSILFLFSSFLIVNIVRILLFSIILLTSFSLFKTLHLITWYFLSAAIVFLIWLLNIKIFKIKKIPVYSDISSLFKVVKKKN